MKRIATLIALLLLACMAVDAKVTMANVCNDGMVLQQKSMAAVWGTATPGAREQAGQPQERDRTSCGSVLGEN